MIIFKACACKSIFTLIFKFNSIIPSTDSPISRCAPWDATCLAALSPIYQTLSPRVFDNLIIEPLELDYFKLQKDGMVFETRNTKINGLKDTVIQELRSVCVELCVSI